MVGATVLVGAFVPEHPAVVAFRVQLAPVAFRQPLPRLVGVHSSGVTQGPAVHPVVQIVERPGRHHHAVVVGPAPDDGVEPPQDGPDTVTFQLTPGVPYLLPQRAHRFLAWPDQELVSCPGGLRTAVELDMEAQEVEPLGQVDDARLFLGEGQTAFGQPGREVLLHAIGVFLALAADYLVVRVAYHRTPSLDFSLRVEPHAESRLHAVQGYVQQQGAYHAALGCTQGRLVKDPTFHDTRLKPLTDQFPSRSLADGLEQEVMVDVVVGPLDVRVEDPLLPLVRAAELVDFPDGILASSTRSEAVAASLEPGLPLRLQRILDHCLKAAVLNGRHTPSALPLFPSPLRDR